MSIIVQAAKDRRPPSNLARYKHAGLNLLANICAEFQARAGGGCFFLSARTASRLVGVNAMAAWRYLRQLKEHGLLLCDERGQPGQNGKATRWRYLGNGDGTECAI